MEILEDINGDPILEVFGNQIVIGGTQLVGTLSLLEASDLMYGFVASSAATSTPTTSISSVTVIAWEQSGIPPGTGSIEELTLAPRVKGRFSATEQDDVCSIFGWIWDANEGYMNAVDVGDEPSMEGRNTNIIRFVVRGEVEILP